MAGGPGQNGQGGAGHAAGRRVAAASPGAVLLAKMQGLVWTSFNTSAYLSELIQSNNSIWCGVTETWLSPNISDSELLVHLPG